MESRNSFLATALIVSLGFLGAETLLLVESLIDTHRMIKEASNTIRATQPKLYELYRPSFEEGRSSRAS